MAEIRPFRAWRYNDEFGKNIEDLTSPLFDVVSRKQLETLYGNPYNSIHISVPSGEEPHNNARHALQEWKERGVLIQDDLPAIYVYYQYFSLPGDMQPRCRKGFICMIKAYDWDEEVILRHESTMPHSVSDRKLILEHTKMNISPTHGLYTDESKTIEKYLDESMHNPIYSTEDYQGVKDVLSVIHDHEKIHEILNLLKDKQIILADGHHRYEGSLAHKAEMKAKNPDHNGTEPYNYHLMYLTNTEADDLRVLPTHRLVHDLPDFDQRSFLTSLEEYFKIKPMENAEDLYEIILGKQWAFGLLIGDEAYRIKLRKSKIEEMRWDLPDVVKHVDLTVMHYFIFEEILGIKGKQQQVSGNISFERNFTTCHSRVLHKEAQFALITNEVPMETIKQVCYTGHIMPQKSTYFYPKAICGYLFGSIDENEFEGEADRCFRLPQET